MGASTKRRMKREALETIRTSQMERRKGGMV